MSLAELERLNSVFCIVVIFGLIVGFCMEGGGFFFKDGAVQVGRNIGGARGSFTGRPNAAGPAGSG